MSLPVDVCLQCGQSREEVERYETICGIEEGYEYRELAYEWPKHHWRDWSDAELRAQGIKPEFLDEHRRTPAMLLQYVPCEHHERGHLYPEQDAYFEKWLVHEKDVCMQCGKRKGDAE